MKKLTAALAGAALAAFIATAAAQSGSSPQGATQPVPGTAVPAIHAVTAEQAAAMWAGTCRVQCPAERNDASAAVSCERTTRSACEQIASSRSNCRADFIPANWCASRNLTAGGN
jgi:hypothetical protein